MIEETPFFLNTLGYRLYCILYRPQCAAKCAVLLCHPFAEEKLWSQRVFVSFARRLAENGYAVLRLDYMGHGDSDGAFSHADVTTRLSDIAAGLDYLKSHLGAHVPLCLIGLRFGATLAALMSEDRKDVEQLILWEPIINGDMYARQLLRINIATQTAVYKQVVKNSEALVEMLHTGKTVNVDGYEIGRTFYEQLTAIDLLRSPLGFNGKVLVVSIVKHKDKVDRQSLRLKEKYPGCDYRTVVEEHFWSNIPHYYKRADRLAEATLQWMEEIYANVTRANRKPDEKPSPWDLASPRR